MFNKKQKEFFCYVLHLTKTSDEPFYCFRSGGAMSAIHTSQRPYIKRQSWSHKAKAGDNFTDLRVLLLAPTSKAAYNTKGHTIHSALAIPANHSLKNYKSLDSSRLNNWDVCLAELNWYFWMKYRWWVCNAMFNVQINNHLTDIKGSALHFNGISIIAVGDLFQLWPGCLIGTYWWQGWCSGESTCLPPMWPGLDFRTWHYMWIEFVGSLLCSERFFPGYSGFPLSSKINIWLDLIRWTIIVLR